MHKAALEITDDQGRVERQSVRPELAAFVIEMEGVLRKHDNHKSGWESLDVGDVFYHIQLEFNELKTVYDERHSDCIGTDGFLTGTEEEQHIRFLEYVQRMREEAIDIANFCMFLCHNYSKVEWLR
jgi:hypothetical protein